MKNKINLIIKIAFIMSIFTFQAQSFALGLGTQPTENQRLIALLKSETYSNYMKQEDVGRLISINVGRTTPCLQPHSINEFIIITKNAGETIHARFEVGNCYGDEVVKKYDF